MITLWERNVLEVTDEEGAILASLARRVPADRCIVEVGSYRGRSTCFLAGGSDEGQRAPIYAVDLWTDAPDEQVNRKGKLRPRPYNLSESREAFDAAVEEHGRGLVTPVQGSSVAVAALFQWPVGLLFLDGSHAYKDVLHDLLHWAPKVAVGGYVALHDWHFKAVRKATRRTLGKEPDKWLAIQKVGRIKVIQRDDPT